MKENPFPNYVPRPGGAEYRKCDLETEEGLDEAAMLKTIGWAIADHTPWSITFWRPKKESERER